MHAFKTWYNLLWSSLEKCNKNLSFVSAVLQSMLTLKQIGRESAKGVDRHIYMYLHIYGWTQADTNHSCISHSLYSIGNNVTIICICMYIQSWPSINLRASGFRTHVMIKIIHTSLSWNCYHTISMSNGEHEISPRLYLTEKSDSVFWKCT